MIQSNGQTHAQRTVSSADKVFQSLGQTHQLEYNPESFLSVLCRCSDKSHDRKCCAGSVIPVTVPRALIFGCSGGLILAGHWYLCNGNFDGCAYDHSLFDANVDLHNYIGLLVALMLVFRTNSSYARYDAGVEAMGHLRVSARTLVSQAAAYIDDIGDDEPSRERQALRKEYVDNVRRLTMLYCLMFKRCVHKEDDPHAPFPGHKSVLKNTGLLLNDHERWDLQRASPTARCVLVTGWLRMQVHEAVKKRLLRPEAAQLMDGTVTTMVGNFQKGCRIAYILMPFPYAQVVKWICAVYCLLSPLAYVDTLRYATPVASFFVALVVFAVDQIGVQIEDPFGQDETDINLGVVMHEIDDQTRWLVTRNGRHVTDAVAPRGGAMTLTQDAQPALLLHYEDDRTRKNTEYHDEYHQMQRAHSLASPRHTHAPAPTPRGALG